MDTGTSYRLGGQDRARNRKAHPHRSGCPKTPVESCFRIPRLRRIYGEARLKTACRRTLILGSCRYGYKSIESILKHRLDQQPLEEQQELAPICRVSRRQMLSSHRISCRASLSGTAYLYS